MKNSFSSDICFRRKHPSFFIKPCLRITTIQTHRLTDKRWGGNDLRCFVYCIVENTGRSPAIQCQAKLSLHEHIDGCHALSDNDTKNLIWQNNETKIDIGAKYDKPYFELAFSQGRLIDSTEPVYCGVSRERARFQSWVGTKDALEQPENRLQDGMCRGRFRVHVEILTIDGQRTFNDFIITVGDDWQALQAEKTECITVKKSLGERIFCKR